MPEVRSTEVTLREDCADLTGKGTVWNDPMNSRKDIIGVGAFYSFSRKGRSHLRFEEGGRDDMIKLGQTFSEKSAPRLRENDSNDVG